MEVVLEALVVYQFVPVHLNMGALEVDWVLEDVNQFVPIHVWVMEAATVEASEAVTEEATVQAVAVVEVVWVLQALNMDQIVPVHVMDCALEEVCEVAYHPANTIYPKALHSSLVDAVHRSKEDVCCVC